MNKKRRHAIGIALVCLCCLMPGITGCEGTDTREQVDDTVEEVVGKKKLDRYRDTKKALGDIEREADDRFKKLDVDGADEK